MIHSSSYAGFTGGDLAVGLSSTIKLALGPDQGNVNLLYNAGGSTIWISGISLAFGNGFPWGITATTRWLNLPGYRGDLYFTTAGATASLGWYKLLTAP